MRCDWWICRSSPGRSYLRSLLDWKPEAVGFSLNYLANVPEVVDLTLETKRRVPGSFVFVGGHTASFISRELLACSEGAIDCVVRGEGESTAPRLLQEVPDGRLDQVPGTVSARGSGPAPDADPGIRSGSLSARARSPGQTQALFHRGAGPLCFHRVQPGLPLSLLLLQRLDLLQSHVSEGHACDDWGRAVSHCGAERICRR